MNAPLLLFILGIALVFCGVVMLGLNRASGSAGGVNFGSLKVEGSSPLILTLSGVALCVFALTWNFAVADSGPSEPDPPPTTEGFPDVDFDNLWDACDSGDSFSCDELYFVTPLGSEYEDFGATCGYRFDDWRFAGSCPG